jgi:hypothetical protein
MSEGFDMDALTFEELKEDLSNANSDRLKEFAESAEKYYRDNTSAFMRIRTKVGSSEDVEPYVEQLLLIAEKRKKVLQRNIAPILDDARKGLLIGPALARAERGLRPDSTDAVPTSHRTEKCADFNACACKLHDIALELSSDLGVPSGSREDSANLLLQKAQVACAATGELTGALKKKSSLKIKPSSKSKKRKKVKKSKKVKKIITSLLQPIKKRYMTKKKRRKGITKRR